jgi:hypothetical protein
MPARSRLALITRAAIRSVAIFAAAITLAGQLAAAAHVHQAADPSSVNAVAQVAADNGLCALCLLAFHTSVAPSAPVTAALPRDYREALTILSSAPVIVAAVDTPLGRAPPASL